MLKTIKVPGAYTLLRVFSTTGNTPKRPPHIASAFLGKYAFITAVDLIQREKLDSRNFYESNLMEAGFNSLPFIIIMTVSTLLEITQIPMSRLTTKQLERYLVY